MITSVPQVSQPQPSRKKYTLIPSCLHDSSVGVKQCLKLLNLNHRMISFCSHESGVRVYLCIKRPTLTCHARIWHQPWKHAYNEERNASQHSNLVSFAFLLQTEAAKNDFDSIQILNTLLHFWLSCQRLAHTKLGNMHRIRRASKECHMIQDFHTLSPSRTKISRQPARINKRMGRARRRPHQQIWQILTLGICTGFGGRAKFVPGTRCQPGRTSPLLRTRGEVGVSCKSDTTTHTDQN